MEIGTSFSHLSCEAFTAYILVPVSTYPGLTRVGLVTT